MKIKNTLIGFLCLASVPFITGGAGWNVPPCDAEAVLDTARIPASIKFNVNELNVRFKNVQNIKLHDGKNRTCVAEAVDKKSGRYLGDYYYQVLVTHGIKWVVTDID